jgi:hypothetical protein
LSSLYWAALTLAHDPKDFDQIAPKLQVNLTWETLQAHPENFFPLRVSDAERAQLNARAPGLIENLQGRHEATMAGRREQGMETLEGLGMPRLEQVPIPKRAGEAPNTRSDDSFDVSCLPVGLYIPDILLNLITFCTHPG